MEPGDSFVQGVHDDESRSDRSCRVDDPLQCVGNEDRSVPLPLQGLGQGEASQQDCRNLCRPAPTDIAWNVTPSHLVGSQRVVAHDGAVFVYPDPCSSRATSSRGSGLLT